MVFWITNTIWQFLKLMIGLIALFLVVWGGWNGLRIETLPVTIELYGIKRFFKKEHSKACSEKGGRTMFNIEEQENRGLPLACDCCDTHYVYHLEKYKLLRVGEVEVNLHQDCYNKFLESVKSFANSLD